MRVREKMGNGTVFHWSPGSQTEKSVVADGLGGADLGPRVALLLAGRRPLYIPNKRFPFIYLARGALLLTGLLN